MSGAVREDGGCTRAVEVTGVVGDEEKLLKTGSQCWPY